MKESDTEVTIPQVIQSTPSGPAGDAVADPMSWFCAGMHEHAGLPAAPPFQDPLENSALMLMQS